MAVAVRGDGNSIERICEIKIAETAEYGVHNQTFFDGIRSKKFNDENKAACEERDACGKIRGKHDENDMKAI